MRKIAWNSMLVFVYVVSSLAPALAEVLRLDYEGFTVWLDGERRGAVKFRYNAQRDHEDFTRHATFSLDPNVSKRCQRTSTARYRHPTPPIATSLVRHIEPVPHVYSVGGSV